VFPGQLYGSEIICPDGPNKNTIILSLGRGILEYVLPMFAGKDLNDPKTRNNFTNAVNSLTKNQLIHELRHVGHCNTNADIVTAERESIKAEYEYISLTSPIVLLPKNGQDLNVITDILK
jgi:hypothetical protein